MYYLNEITQLEELINKVQVERAELRKSSDLKVQEVFNNHFNIFRIVDVQVSGESAYFRVKDEETGSLKDLFSIYFYSRYKEDTRLELSYYTTSTNSEFELNRIIYLGQVAKVIKDNSEEILKEIAEVKGRDLGRENELYRIQDTYEREKKSYENANNQKRKVEIELSLRGEGVTFDQPVYIQFKRNYSIKVRTLKMIDVSKSGKTCTMIYTTRDGFSTREENCNVENIINQVVYFHKNIVQEEVLV